MTNEFVTQTQAEYLVYYLEMDKGKPFFAPASILVHSPLSFEEAKYHAQKRSLETKQYNRQYIVFEYSKVQFILCAFEKGEQIKISQLMFDASER